MRASGGERHTTRLWEITAGIAHKKSAGTPAQGGEWRSCTALRDGSPQGGIHPMPLTQTLQGKSGTNLVRRDPIH